MESPFKAMVALKQSGRVDARATTFTCVDLAELLPEDRPPVDYIDIACRAILVRGGAAPDGDVIKVNKTEQVWLRAMPEGEPARIPEGGRQ